ncbi:HU family DNA-binding protein [Pseudobdellovibrio exovorus]|uniref:DNA-binding protein HU-alpha (HU-2) n=1 Tax=Pseudobdellovibrio exovorus JSS TaxID=1184267 RepID=M4VQR3_9BACT|nr:HU family DNA-binding protein [Pseudobdellovibrio exovorus]AGH95484.1 DNA-binding protein HU-alpha (HU-2) [Pseudobdellovibrio exovorus JSS]
MNKAELVAAIASKTKTSRSQVEAYLEVTLSIIQKTVSKGEEVKLVGFGSFSKAERKAKTARNPKTGQAIQLPSTNVPRFKPGKEFKDIVK